MSRRDNVKSIDIIETRFKIEAEQSAASNNNAESLSSRGKIIYMIVRGDNYLQLTRYPTDEAKAKDPKYSERFEEFYRRAQSSYTDANSLATELLDPFDPMRLLSVYSLCKCLVARGGRLRNQAREIAADAFILANVHTNVNKPALSEQLLQSLRDEFMTLPRYRSDRRSSVTTTLAAGKGPVDDTNVALEDSDDKGSMSSDGEGGNNEVEVNAKQEKVKKDTGQREEAKVVFDPYADVEISASALMFVDRLRKNVSRSRPIMVEEMMSVAETFSALDRIFKVYVKANSLPGQLETGTAVTLGGCSITMSSFLLRGPYMSWKGFLAVLRDFNIAQCPVKKSKLGRSFPYDLWSSTSISNISEPPLTMQEAACIFIESSRTATPTVVIRASLPQYTEIAKTLTVDPYREAAEWFDREDWEINNGLNFAQFCDAMCKCGALAYSSSTFIEALPTMKDKIEHFLSAHMGLTNPEKWRKRLENRLRTIKETVSTLRASASTPSLKKNPVPQNGRKL